MSVLAVRDLAVDYRTRRGPVRAVDGIDLTILPGQLVAVVGETGSGKTTAALAAIGLLPEGASRVRGSVEVGGRDITTWNRRRLQTLHGSEIGFVPQESLLFSETILDNLTYGAATPDAARWAAGVAQLTEAIDGFPAGWDTMLGERGVNLSGGQKQRAALARALARRPSVVILDDALSAVDTHTEAAILRGLREALAGRTAIIASHRITAIRDAHWIIVLDEGRVVEQGRHAELLAARGRYWQLLRRQQLEDEIETPGEATVQA